MDWITPIISAASSVDLSVAGACWFSKQWVKHMLETRMEEHKAELAAGLQAQKSTLDGELAKQKAVFEGNIRTAVESFLGERAADREYELEARKRLYTTIGPLRFQLLIACRDLAGRIETHPRRNYSTAVDRYYGRSTLFRILWPLAVAELIERQIAYADFSVDPSALNLLRFKRAAFAALTGGSIVCNHPNAD